MSSFDNTEAILNNIVAQPLAKTEADLAALANAEPQNPFPLLTLATVKAFSQPERFGEAAAVLTTAGARVSNSTNDPEMAFSAAFYSALQSQFSLIQVQGNNAQVSGDSQAHDKAQTAIANLKSAASSVPQSSLAQTISAGVKTFSWNGAYVKANYSEGVAELTSLKAQGSQRDLSAFFLIYAHRRAGNYQNAISIGQELEQRQPNSALVKKTIGSCYYFAGDNGSAEKYYRQALALSKDDPTVQIGLAHILAKKGDVGHARQFLANAKQLDSAGRLAPYISALDGQLKP